AVTAIAASKHRFVSRGDDSGTHKRERSLWELAGGRPEWKNYVESGQGMGATLAMADEMNAYVLTDEGTWLKQSGNFQLVPLVTGADQLRNPYAVMQVNPAKNPAIAAHLAGAFVDFLIAPQTQRLIADYRVNGRVLFHPDRLKKEGAE
ncbi:MAG: substrate-binding domain-containing protein, partial [Planctomycetota bacterium]|nr:substrate-binding domain-containing protein [Planctomycetota bacterium]